MAYFDLNEATVAKSVRPDGLDPIEVLGNSFPELETLFISKLKKWRKDLN